MAPDDTTLVVAAEYLAEVTGGNGQLHIAVHIGIVGSGVNQRDKC